MAKRENGFVRFNSDMLELDAVKDLALYTHSVAEAAAFVGLLVAFGIQHADDTGNLVLYSTKAIERACGWSGNERRQSGMLLSWFMECGILLGGVDNYEDPLRIEPGLWEVLAGDVIEARIKDKERKRAARKAAK